MNEVAHSRHQSDREHMLANLPFGKKSSVTITNKDGKSPRNRSPSTATIFRATTSNKQLNFLHRIFTIVKQRGRATVVLLDNVLFAWGVGETIPRELFPCSKTAK